MRVASTSLATAVVLAVACGEPRGSGVGEVPAARATGRGVADAKVTGLIGTTPPEWQVSRWLRSQPLRLVDLRGSVVVVRWWTAGCPYCSTSAPALRDLHRDFAARGVRVIGLYHHKESTPFDPAVYEATAAKYGFEFPLAVDDDWITFNRWMRDRHGDTVDSGFTSVTFVLDRAGAVRFVHPGGQYVAGDPAHAALVAAIEDALGGD